MPKTGKNGQQMVTFNFFFHRFSDSKLPHKMVLAVFTRCLVPEICILCHFGLKMGLKHPKNGKISEFFFSSFFWLETTSKNGTSNLHTMFGSRDMHFMLFWGKNGTKMPKNFQISEKKIPSFFWLETTSKNGTSHFHTMFGSRVMHFMSFWGKIRIFGSEFQPNQINYS